MEIENKDHTAFPFILDSYISGGLTKREYFAGLALQGLLTNERTDVNRTTVVELAVQYADRILEELEK